MFTLTDNPILAFHYNHPTLLLIILIFAAALSGIPLVAKLLDTDSRKKKGQVPLALIMLASLGAGLTTAITVPQNGNVDNQKLYTAIEDQTSLERIEINNDGFSENLPLHRAIDGSPINQNSATLIGYHDSHEITFKISMDNSTGQITDLIIIRPATGVPAEEILNG